MRVLGLSCDYHDAAAAMVVDGQVVAAAEEERFSRRKHDPGLPVNAIASCLAIAGLDPDDLDAVVFHEKPLAVVNRVVTARQRRGPVALGRFAREMPTLLGQNALVGFRIEQALRRLGATRAPKIAFGEHHLSHAYAAFGPSPFGSAAILTIDGVGEWATATIGHGLGSRVELLEEQRYPDSLGLLYSLMTYWCGFEVNEGEYKLMGLAPFGVPRFAGPLAEVASVHPDGSLQVRHRAVRWWESTRRPSKELVSLLGPPRRPGAPLTQRDADIARSVQDVTETAVLAMAQHAHELTGEPSVCLAGGVALNCVANGRLVREGPFSQVWVQPSPGDAGSAIGAAIWYAHNELGERRSRDDRDADSMAGSQLGPWFDGEQISGWLSDEGVEHRRLEDVDELSRAVASRLADGAIVGWFRGRMEFGPRALGHRSILADPRSPDVHREVNVRVKGRESFRPFAPAVLWEQTAEWFELDRPSPYMLLTCRVAEHRLVPVDREPESFEARASTVRSQIPACTHVDGSARVQTVHPGSSPDFHRLLSAFFERTGCPVLLNTSFNRAGDPIVCTPQDALDTARSTGLDLLVLENCLIELDPFGRT